MAVAVAVPFSDFVREHGAGLLRTAYLLTGDRAGAEDLVQDTLLRLYPRWERVAAADAPLAYVRRSLSNAFISDTRRPWRREVATAMIPEGAERYVADPDRLADSDALAHALLRLPQRQRAALVMRFYDDLADADIAAALDCRQTTVRSLISRGLAELRHSSAELKGAGDD